MRLKFYVEKYIDCAPKLAEWMETTEEWEMGKRYLNMDVENETTALNQNRIYRKNVA